jgi:hypothetical protein
MSLTARRALMAIGWLAILGFTVNAVVQDGVSLLYRAWTDSWSSCLIINDFLIELILVSIFIYFDARRRGKNPIPWIITTLILGAIGSLGYLLVRSFDKDAPPLFPTGPAAAPAGGSDRVG